MTPRRKGFTGLLAWLQTTALAAAPLSVWSGQILSLGANDGAPPAACFYHPSAVAAGGGNLYVTDTGNDTVRCIGPDGTVTTLAGQAGIPGASDGAGSAAQFFDPQAAAVGSDGTVYVADTGNSTIRRISPAGVVATLAGLAGSPGCADGSGSAAAFNRPAGLAVDAAGSLYVADTDSDTIRKISAAGVVTTLAGAAGQAGSADGPGPLARFDHPHGLALDGAGNLYVADTGNDTVRRIGADGSVSTLAGQVGIEGTVDGPATAALLAEPVGVAVDGGGTLYVSGRADGTVRTVSASGAVSTYFASASSSPPASPLAQPEGMAIDGAGNLYLADTYNDVIRTAALAAAPGAGLPASGPAPGQAPTVSGNPPAAGTGNSPSTSIASESNGGASPAPAAGSRLVDLSARAAGGSAPGGLAVGFVISGSSPKTALLRAVGPGLQAFGLADTLANPNIALMSGGAMIAASGAWANSPMLEAMFSQVGTFPLSAASPDSAQLDQLSAGSYSAVITGGGDPSALVLAEIYDGDSASSASRLVNLSVRAMAGSGAQALLAGFVISGTVPETVLIRGVGPGLASFGVPHPLAAPQLVLADSSGNILASNAGWGGQPVLSQLFAALGAFPLGPSSSDAALLVTLPPGAYSAQLTPAAGEPPGNGLIEVYEVAGANP